MSVSAPLTLKGFQQYLKGLPKSLNKAVVRGIQTGAQRAVGMLVAAGDAKKVFDTGVYRRSWRAINEVDGAIVTNSSLYSDVIERGRRAGTRMPPLRDIARWAQRKMGLTAEEARRAAFPIARAIARRGLPARLVLADTTPAIVQVVIDEIGDSITRALRGEAT